MKRFIILACTILTATYSFADIPSNMNKLSPAISSLSAAWRTQQIPSVNKNNDITIVYGGADISSRPTLITHTTLA